MIFTPKKHIAIENREERTDFDNIPKSKEIPTQLKEETVPESRPRFYKGFRDHFTFTRK